MPNEGKVRITFPSGFILGESIVTSTKNLNPVLPTKTILSTTIIEFVGSSFEAKNIEF